MKNLFIIDSPSSPKKFFSSIKFALKIHDQTISNDHLQINSPSIFNFVILDQERCLNTHAIKLTSRIEFTLVEIYLMI